jgi:hypothetical protein
MSDEKGPVDGPPPGELVLYQTEDGRARVQCRFAGETIWLTQALIGELFDRDVRTINEHLQNLYEDDELTPEATIRKFRIVRREGLRDVTRLIDHFNLEAVLAVGYRVRSARGVQFRRWATERLAEYLTKGFTLDDDRLKNPPAPRLGMAPDFFAELLERIRDIRASEKRMYLRVREIFAMATDYAPSNDETMRFFQAIQNKLHFAVTGLTAPEIILRRADHIAPKMGLTTTASTNVRQSDVVVAKNYLIETEITELNRIVTMWLDFAEDQALRRQQVFLRDWEEKLDSFLTFNEREVLPNRGTISRETADAHAKAEFELFAAARRALLEAEGQIAINGGLEAAAKRLPNAKRTKKNGDST